MNFSTLGDNFTMLNIHFLYRQIVNNLFMPTTRVCARVRERDDQSSLELRLLLSCTVNSSSLVIFGPYTYLVQNGEILNAHYN